MQMNNFSRWEDLPIGLSATQIAKILGLSKPLVYDLFHRGDFPALKVSQKRWLVPRDQFRSWLDNESAKTGNVPND